MNSPESYKCYGQPFETSSGGWFAPFDSKLEGLAQKVLAALPATLRAALA
ncbi:hypothetical protein PYH37_001532 [Sinorhizobium numidicum]|uniref:Uncharacterized protein n=1 Tax=Sinorhizobium numidicum TaxID=680248 RepID=A0ABY8CRP6_9HYPH|nr:hypothetical protein [Sinorhizobium numidicum]WEX74147.1 hypothetical protein PYH37_001532 [Sinorhizobium numidicum]WEX80132.1 hypothetical protein PYH38_001533 [Sinorhizobium numidicum]